MPKDIIKKFQDQYGKEAGKKVYYATANKQDRDPETFEKIDENLRKQYGVGKYIGGTLYFHKTYVDDIVPPDVLSKALSLIGDDIKTYNIIKYSPKENKISFLQSSDFDSAREPLVDYGYSVDLNKEKTGLRKVGQIYHHKWQFVKPDYTGFDYNESQEWSKLWSSKFKEAGLKLSDIGWKQKWEDKLQQVGLPLDNMKEQLKEIIKESLEEMMDVKKISTSMNSIITSMEKLPTVDKVLTSHSKLDGWHGEILGADGTVYEIDMKPKSKPVNESVFEEEYVNGFISEDYSAINGYAYRLKECGVDSKMGYNNGKHNLMIRRDHLGNAIDVLKNSADELGYTVAERLQRRYFAKM